MIKTLSPYNLSIPFVAPISGLTCTSYTLELFVWNGYKTTPPTNATWLMTKGNPTASIESDKVDIARIISDFINFTPNDTTTTELINGDNQYWVKYQIYYETADSDDFVPNYVTTQLILKGYSYGMEGVNAQPPVNKILLTGAEFKVNRNGYFVFPFLIEEATPVETFFATITDYDGDCLFFEFNIPYDELTVIIQDSTDSGVTWRNKTESSISPACEYEYPDVPTWFRLKSTGDNIFYSNIFIYTP
jgi:hypothetical protein